MGIRVVRVDAKTNCNGECKNPNKSTRRQKSNEVQKINTKNHQPSFKFSKNNSLQVILNGQHGIKQCGNLTDASEGFKVFGELEDGLGEIKKRRRVVELVAVGKSH